jgi:hypothetical protein
MRKKKSAGLRQAPSRIERFVASKAGVRFERVLADWEKGLLILVGGFFILAFIIALMFVLAGSS